MSPPPRQSRRARRRGRPRDAVSRHLRHSRDTTDHRRVRTSSMTSGFGSSFRDRLDYASIHNRAPLSLPGNARVAVWTIVNVENWSPSGAMPRTILPPPMAQPLLPDLPNWAWHEYGMRVGFWRFLEALNARNLKATLAVY